MRFLLAFLLLLGGPAWMCAQRVACQVDPQTAFLGERVVYQVLVHGVAKATCALPEVPGLLFTRRQEGVVNTSHQITIINGVRQERDTADYLFSFKVQAAKAGRFEIASPVVQVGKLRLRGAAVLLEVKDPSQQDLADIRFEALPARVLRGQSFTLQVTIWLKHLPDFLGDHDPLSRHDRRSGFFDRGTLAPGLYLPWLPAPPQGLSGWKDRDWLRKNLAVRGQGGGFRLVDADQRSFSGGLSGARFAHVMKDVQKRDREGHLAGYRRYTFSLKLLAEVVGRYTFKPATLRGNLVQEGPRRNGRPRAFWEDIFVQSQPVTVTVAEPPVTGRPAGFSGAVGRFKLLLEPPAPTTVEVGQPIYLTLVVQGEGYLKGVDLDPARDLGRDFRVVKVRAPLDSMTAGTDRPPGFPSRPGHWRQFDFKIFPKSSAVHEIPPVSFSFYDPGQQRYVVRETRAVPLTVKKRPVLSPGVVVGSEPRGDAVELVPTSSLSANVDDLNLLDNQAPRLMPFVPILAALPLLYFLCAFLVGRRRRLREDPLLRRRLQAGPRVAKRLKEARERAGSDPKGALELALAASLGLLADLEGKQETALTGKDLRSWVQVLPGSGSELRAGVEELCTAVEASLFGGGGADALVLDRLLATTQELAEVALKKSRKKGRGKLRGIWLLALVLWVPGCQRSTQRAELFREAQGAYKKKDYARAEESFQKLLRGGYRNGYVLFNLGNCRLRQNRLGRAIAAYRQAERLLPGDANIKVNLRRALEARRQPLSLPPDKGIFRYLFFWRRDLPFRSEALVTTLLGVLIFGLALARLLLNRPWPFVKASCWVLLTVMLLLGTSSALDYEEARHPRHGVVVVAETTLRKGPGSSFDPSFTQKVQEGSEFSLLASRGSWLKVLMGGRYPGWVPRSAVALW